MASLSTEILPVTNGVAITTWRNDRGQLEPVSEILILDSTARPTGPWPVKAFGPEMVFKAYFRGDIHSEDPMLCTISSSDEPKVVSLILPREEAMNIAHTMAAVLYVKEPKLAEITPLPRLRVVED